MPMKTADKIRRNAYDMLRQATAARLSRRDALRMGLVAGTGGILSTQLAGVAKSSDGSDDEPIPGDDFVPNSPPTRPWKTALPIPPVLQPIAGTLSPTRDHQYWRAPYLPQKFYEVSASEAPHQFHIDLPYSPIWGLAGSFPGPTIDAQYGVPWFLRVHNNLPALDTHTGFGVPQTIYHLHNAHTATRSDGGPWDWDDPGGATEYHHLMMRAGFQTNTVPTAYRDAYDGDVRETLTTLWLHYHRPEFTAAGAYKGLLNMVRFFDDKDTGNERTRARRPGVCRAVRTTSR
jgi:FtsP/CotA-like multicopper oxidase with cupredoxin domain